MKTTQIKRDLYWIASSLGSLGRGLDNAPEVLSSNALNFVGKRLTSISEQIEKLRDEVLDADADRMKGRESGETVRVRDHGPGETGQRREPGPGR